MKALLKLSNIRRCTISRSLHASILTLATLLLCPLLSAQEFETSCEATLQSCFAYSHQARSSCLYAKSDTSECANSATGALAKIRAQLHLHALPTEHKNTPEEPYTLNSDCLRNFDHLWLGALVHEDNTQETTESLEESLLSCVKQAPNQLLRP